MTYIKVRWVHDFPEEPVMIIAELDDGEYENRKIEIFRDHRIAYATKDLEIGTFLATVAYSYEEIAADPQFDPCKITKQELEQLWRERVGDSSNDYGNEKV